MVAFRKKPVVIEAVQFVYPDFDSVAEFAGQVKLRMRLRDAQGRTCLSIPTLEGWVIANDGDWIIRGIKGELYPCKPDIFEATYEPVAPSPAPAQKTGGDLVERLQREATMFREEAGVKNAFVAEMQDATAELLSDAAAALSEERKRADAAEATVGRLRAALEPFAKAAAEYDPEENDWREPAWNSHFMVEDLRRARAALQESTDG